MNKVIFAVLFVISFSVLVGSQNVFAVTETVFDEDFDGVLVGWSESLCIKSEPAGQTCSMQQTTQLIDTPFESPTSPPNWGFVEIFDFTQQGFPGSAEVRYQKDFNVVTEDDYDISAVLAVKDCQGGTDPCHIASKVYVDGILIFEQAGPDISREPRFPTHIFFEQSSIHLTAGTHDLELGMFIPALFGGNSRGSFDDVLIQREAPEQVVGGSMVPIDKTALLLA
ncbi:MAG: hypothetical protein ACREAK_11555, partial [Nitrosarchaeum sp.]